MSRSIHQFFPRTKTGNTIPGAEYTVKDATSGLDVDIFDSADSETPKTQPYKADGNGKVLFYIEPGIYNIDSTDLRTGSTGSKVDVTIGVSRREIDDNNGVKQFDKTYSTVADMKADTSLQANGSKLINTVDYYSTQRGGGASYLIKTPTQATADGDIYSATTTGNILLDNGNVAVLQLDNGTLTLDKFGAGLGFDDSDAVLEALSSELAIRGVDGVSYLITKELNVVDKDITLLSSPSSTFLFASDTARFNFEYIYTDIQDVSNVDNTAEIDMSNGTAATLTPSSKLTVTNGASYSAGDAIKVVSDDTIFGTNPTDSEKIGEHAVIFEVQGNDVYLDRRLRANDGSYTTNPRIAKSSEKSCYLGSFKIDGDYDNTPNRNLSYIRVVGCAKLKTDGKICSKRTQASVFNPSSCHQPDIDTLSAVDGRTNSSVGAFAHGILFTSGTTDFSVNSVFGRNLRHLVDTTAVSSSALDEIWRYGGVVGGYTDHILGIGMQGAPASTHNDSEQVSFGSVISLKPVHGPNGIQTGIGLRGRNNSVQYVEIDDGTAVFCFTDHASNNNSRDHTIGKIVVNNRGQHDRTRAINILGQSGAKVGGVHVGEVVFKNMKNNNISPIVRCENGSVRVEKVFSIGGSSDDTIDLIDCNIGGTIDIDRFIGRDTQNFSLIDMDDDSCVVKIDSIDIETDQTFGVLANLNNTDSYLRIREARINNRGSSSDLIANRGLGADIIADWQLTNSDETSDRNRRRLPSIFATSATAFDIEISDNGAPVMQQKFINTVAGCSVGSISDGNYFGQQVIIYNNFSNSNDLLVPDNASGLRLNSTVTLQPSQSITAFWSGFEWVVAS